LVSPAEAKAVLRAELRAERRGLPYATAAAEAAATCDLLADWIAADPPPSVASYLAATGELDLDALHHRLWAQGRPILLPRVVGERLVWHAITAPDQVAPGSFGVREPLPGCTPVLPLPTGCLLVAPGVGFGRDGRRLGQSGGFYDRTLADFRGCAIGVGFACQRRDELPLEAHDRPLDGVILGGAWLLRPPTPPRQARATGA
jgi:5-formyltetrahydrofolate cyclo-ligase